MSAKCDIILLFDSFKHSANAYQMCNWTEELLHAINPKLSILKIPLADGGEGSLDVINNTGVLVKQELYIHDPLFRSINSYYCYNEDTAFIELALASGLQLLSRQEQNCMQTSTYGTGELIQHAIRAGFQNIVLFIGGSATTDAGIGAAAALGFKFLNVHGAELQPIGANLIKVDKIIPPDCLFDVNLKIACDVRNILYGSGGAAHVYAKQKGASETDIACLDAGLRQINSVIMKMGFPDLSAIAGMGAAGGFPAMFCSFFNASIVSGSNFIFEFLNVEENINNSQLIITGEGKTDVQTLNGKLVSSVCKVAQKYGKPVWEICGSIENEHEIQQKLKIEHVFALSNNVEESFLSIKNPKHYLDFLSEEIKVALVEFQKKRST